MSIDLSQFHQAFFAESVEHLEEMEQLLLALNVYDPDPEALNAIFRAAHSVKGSSGTFGFTDIADTTHVLESLLDRVRKQELVITSEMIDCFLEAKDLLRRMLDACQNQGVVDPDEISLLCGKLRSLSGDAPKATRAPANGPLPVFDDLPSETEEAVVTPAPEVNETVDGEDDDDSFGFFEPMPRPLEEAHVIANDPAAIEDDDEGFGFFTPIGTGNRVPAVVPLEDVVKPSTSEPVKTPEGKKPESQPRGSAPASADSSIRVSVEKVDQLINLVGELVITQAMLLQTAVQMQESASENLMLGLTQLERNTRDLQESVMSIRMLPISFVFSRFPRVVRDLSGKLGKKVELKLTGEHTELDKGLIERMADPLTHLVRNSLDHGIETPEKREAVGKNPVGLITLKAYHQGGNIVVEVGDDGAGIDRQKILAKARDRGLQVSEQMSDQEVFALIFEPGFSTAEVVSDVSGRGVGMDVVRRNIQGMGGRVEIESMLGVGTRMTVRLPLTLAILDGMSVAVGDQVYILPLSTVVESLQPRAGDIKTMANQGRVIQVRNEYLPLVVLHEIFGLQAKVTDFTQGILVILDADGAKAALFVDALVGQHQVVIKSLEANYRRVHGISGATIMGDGQVAMILDVSAIVGMTRTKTTSMSSAA